MRDATSTKKAELKKVLWRITEIYINAKENFSICYYLHQPDSKDEFEYLQKDRVLRFVRHSLWRLCIIELSKLLSGRPSDKFTLTRLLERLKPDGQFAVLQLDQQKVADWEDYIVSRSDIISNVVTLRDKIYAHTDPDKDDYRATELYFTQIEELFQLVEKILIEIESVVFDTMLDLRTPIFDRGNFDLVRILSAHHKKRINEFATILKKDRQQ